MMKLGLLDINVEKRNVSGRGINYNYHDCFKECMIHYQKIVKIAKANYFSHLIAKNGHSPKILFNTINSVLNPMSNLYPDPSPMACENFVIRLCIVPSSLDLDLI